MYLYFILSVGDSIGSYNEFKERLENNPEDFTYCYYKCKTLGIVDSWHDFIMQIFAPNCEECREELEEELSRYEDEKNDYYEEMNDYYNDHNMDNHH